MNNWILFLFLSFLFYLSYVFHGRKIGPANILILDFLIPITLILCMSSYFEYVLSADTITIIICFVCLFVIGETIIITSGKKRKEKKCKCIILDINKKYSIFVLVIQVVNLLLTIRYVLMVGAYYGASGLLSSYAANRLNQTQLFINGYTEINPPFINYMFSQFANAVEIVSLHVLLFRVFILKNKVSNSKWLAWSVIVFLLSTILDSGRLSVVPTIIHAFYVFIIFSGGSFANLIKRYYAKIGIALSAIFLFFVVSGSIRDRENINEVQGETIDVVNAIAMYVGSPIVGLDHYINAGMKSYPNMGENMFKIVYDILRKLGLNFEHLQLHEETFYLKNIASNAYSGLCFWIRDFKLIGALCFALIIGAVFGTIYIKTQNNIIRKDNIIGVYICSMMYYALIMAFFNDQFRFILSEDMIIKIIIIYIVQKAIVIKYKYVSTNQIYYNN